jgi:hypothetical protein
MREQTASGCLERAMRELSEDGVERRHEVLMQEAVTELGLELAEAEQIYALAEEEKLEPVFAFQLVRCGVGVRELEPPAQDAEESAAQEAPPSWLATEAVELDDVALERRLRLSFRRFRGLLEDSGGDALAAARAFMAEPDVGPLSVS